LTAAALSAALFTAPPALADDAGTPSRTTTSSSYNYSETNGYDWANGMYISGAAGWSFEHDTRFSGPGLPGGSGDRHRDGTVPYSIAVGTDVTPNVRAELETSFRRAGVSDGNIDGHLKTWTVMANGYYDFNNTTPFTPYVTGGIGAAIHDGEFGGPGYSASGTTTKLAWKLGTGLNYALAKQTELFGGYQWLASTDPKFDDTKVKYDAHEVLAGVRYHFQ
jgi:opacity protein-like surface antigen